MKKILVTISVILFFTGNIINAQVTPKDGTKTSTETKMNCGKCPQTKECGMMTDSKTTKTGSAKCKEMGCDSTKCKVKCDPAKCKSGSEGTTAQKKDCDPTKCKMMSKN
jgi:hypothetical protein